MNPQSLEITVILGSKNFLKKKILEIMLFRNN